MSPKYSGVDNKPVISQCMKQTVNGGQGLEASGFGQGHGTTQGPVQVQVLVKETNQQQDQERKKLEEGQDEPAAPVIYRPVLAPRMSMAVRLQYQEQQQKQQGSPIMAATPVSMPHAAAYLRLADPCQYADSHAHTILPTIKKSYQHGNANSYPCTHAAAYYTRTSPISTAPASAPASNVPATSTTLPAIPGVLPEPISTVISTAPDASVRPWLGNTLQVPRVWSGTRV
ncbi:hypothetical protein BGZ67_002958 [Mortierella alpina]|nr:hypothetical protein BGZ67_002958 [Mortierella alpina]